MLVDQILPAPGVAEQSAISATRLTRRFGDFIAVDRIDLHVPRGSFFGFLGPNGAGKSTTIKMLTGMLAPTEGRIRILSHDLTSDPTPVKRVIGVVPEDLNLFDRLTGAEFLTFVGRMHELDRRVVAERTAELLRMMELEDKPRALLVEYSHGMRKKISLAAALIHNPQVLFLDEPFEGVDAVAARSIKNLLERMRGRGVTIFLTSHILEIVERLCTDIAVINEGRIVAAGTLAELRSSGGATLEDYFVRLVGGERPMAETLSWIG
ncbi:MAG TPA: ABC transporter ATP-binding protein [Blastocatellia bacterium]|nr:ABC transporter ATP-binding protein [Blastocatellia bacterium]